MSSDVRERLRAAHCRLPPDIRRTPATEAQLESFERAFGAIPPEVRWSLATLGGGAIGSEWLDGIDELAASQRKFARESGAGGWSVSDAFVVGWDGAGNPIAVSRDSGAVLVEDHNFGEIRELAPSFEAFLVAQLLG